MIIKNLYKNKTTLTKFVLNRNSNDVILTIDSITVIVSYEVN